MDFTQQDLDALLASCYEVVTTDPVYAQAVKYVIDMWNTFTQHDLDVLLQSCYEVATTDPFYREVVSQIMNPYPEFTWQHLDELLRSCQETVVVDTTSLHPIPKCPGYLSTYHARIWSVSHKKFLKTAFNNGYEVIKLRVENPDKNSPVKMIDKNFRVHQLVARTFLVNTCGEDAVVNHLDGRRNNNHVLNLEWCSQSANVMHSYANGNRTNFKRAVIQLSTDGKEIARYESIDAASKATNTSAVQIGNVCKERHKTAKGFVWIYVEPAAKVDPTGWKPWPGDAKYLISENAEVYNTFTKQLQRQNLLDGYKMVTLNRKREFVHRVVAQTYLHNDDPVNKKNVNHKDGNRANSKVSNLEWCSQSQNMKHAHDTGLNKGSKQVRRIHKITGEIKTYQTIRKASEDGDCHSRAISNACKNKKVTDLVPASFYEYVWEFIKV